MKKYLSYLFKIHENYALHTCFLLLNFWGILCKCWLTPGVFWSILIPSIFLFFFHYFFITSQQIACSICQFFVIFTMLGLPFIFLIHPPHYVPTYSFHILVLNVLIMLWIHIYAIKKGLYIKV
jgi:hypothetical protein